MEQMYQDYRDIAEFRMVYIREAHAIDSNWPMKIAEEKNIREHTSREQRCTTAGMLINDKSLTIPTLIDGMDNAVNEMYGAHPDRIFLIRRDGRVAVAAAPGPWGFAPALEAAGQWLAEFKKTGAEPPLPAEGIAGAEHPESDRPAQPDGPDRNQP